MNRKPICLILAAITLIGSAIASETVCQLADKDNGKKVTLTQGTPIVIELVGNPSTGYNWSVDVPLKLIKTGPVTTNPNLKPGEKPKVGSPSKILLTFETPKTGKETIKLRYYRVWEKKASSDKRTPCRPHARVRQSGHRPGDAR